MDKNYDYENMSDNMDNEYTFHDVDSISTIMNVNSDILSNSYDNNISLNPEYTLLTMKSPSPNLFDNKNKLKKLLTDWNLQSVYNTCIGNYTKTNIQVYYKNIIIKLFNI